MTMKEKRAQRLAQIRGESQKDDKSKQANEEKKPALYPNATRVAPKAQATGKLMKQLQSLQELYEKPDMVGVMAKAEEIASMPIANSYDKSYVYSLAANAASDQDDQAKAEDYFSKAVESNGLDNDSHFNTMFNLAVIQYQQEKYQEALATIDRFLMEGKSEKTEHLNFRASLLANLGRNEEAAAVYKALIVKSPDDKRLLMNAVATLQAADNFAEANLLLEDAYKRGMLTEGKELRVLYVGYINASRWNDAKEVMEAGSSKGILEAGPQLAKDYMVLAQNAYAEDNLPLAVEMYTKAGPIAADGEAYLNLAKVLDISGKKADAKAAAQKALDKGLKKPEEAKRILSL
ncbi:MAG: tetratricopeptide repeat protein [Thermomonas sp.]